MIVSQNKVLKLVKQQKIVRPLKSYVDTLLFYYLGYLSAKNSKGDLSEIGVGGSTHVLMELSEILKCNFYIFDIDQQEMSRFATTEFWPDSNPKVYVDDSLNLHNYKNLSNFAYCHIDGSKDYNVTLSDINFYLSHLAHNGIICQDDYGNNKWPTITDAVKFLESTNQIKLILVGDSSVWFTKPEYYEFWTTLLETDYEFSLLKFLCNIVNSRDLNKLPNYYFLQKNFLQQDKQTEPTFELFSDSEKKYFKDLVDTETFSYLQMPYQTQSTIVGSLKNNSKFFIYRLSLIYNSIKGHSWPNSVPTTKEEIDKLPQWIKDELINLHNIDPYYGFYI